MIKGRDAAPEWEVEFHDDFDTEFDALRQDVQDELLATAEAVQRLGPGAGRPHVGTLNNPPHPNMKELRFTGNNGAEIWRAAFAFDARRKAIVLVAADKQGKDEQKFYRNLLRVANERFDGHLAMLTQAARLVGPAAQARPSNRLAASKAKSASSGSRSKRR